MTTATIELASQNGLDISKTTVTRVKGSEYADITAFEGEPVVIHVRTSVARIRPPESGLSLQVFRDGEVVLAVSFTEWTQHGSASDRDGADFSSTEYRGILQASPSGSYVFKVAPVGCDRSRRDNYAGRAVRLEVRPLATPRDHAQLHMYRAKRAAFFLRNCEAALLELAAVDAYDPNEFQAMSLRAACAREAGELEKALTLYEKLQAGLAEKRRTTGLGNKLRGFEADIHEMRQKLGR